MMGSLIEFTRTSIGVFFEPPAVHQLSIGRDEEVPLTPVQRMQGKILLADPEMARRIIFDPSLEP